MDENINILWTVFFDYYVNIVKSWKYKDGVLKGEISDITQKDEKGMLLLIFHGWRQLFQSFFYIT